METNDAAVYVASVLPTIDDTLPHNLPVATGTHLDTLPHSEILVMDDVLASEETAAYTALENQAHTERVLLSSDALRLFTEKIQVPSERTEVLAALIKKARTSFPSEDGWVVLNVLRMEELLAQYVPAENKLAVNTTLENSVSYVPMTASSLAEMILAKNVQSACKLVADRPMVALADAVSDFHTLIAIKTGGVGKVSDLLTTQSAELSNSTLAQVVGALTSALDGTYTNEREAVEHAIVKAIGVLG